MQSYSLNIRGLDWEILKEKISLRAHSKKAAIKINNLQPLSEVIEISDSVEAILSVQSFLELEHSPNLSSLDDLPGILERLKNQGVLNIKELVLLRGFINAAISLKDFLKPHKQKWFTSTVSKIMDFKPQIYAIDQIVAPDGEIREDASSTLSALSGEKKRLTRDVAKSLESIISKRSLENSLQEKYVTTREGRLVVPVKSGSQHDLKGIIHDSSQTKQTVFIEPDEVVPLNNRLREVLIEIDEEIAKLLRQLSNYLASHLNGLINAEDALLDSDIVFAKSRFNQSIEGIAFSISNSNQLSLKDARHPLLSAQGEKVVPNTIKLDSNHRILILSGPNAGGKTILLKTLGLISIMGLCGLPIPCGEGSQLILFKNIFAIIGDNQSVNEHLSSFSSHVLKLKETLNLEGPSSLILVDEICGATDPEEGAALAKSFLETYCERQVFAVITSHLGPLKDTWEEKFPVQHGSFEFDSKTNRPTYQLFWGIPGRSLALYTAQSLGVPENIIARASKLLAPSTQERVKGLEEVEKLKQQIIQFKEETTKDRDAAKAAKQQYEKLIQKFREQRDAWLEKALQKAQVKIDNLIEEARQDRLRNKTLQDLKSDLPEIITARSNKNMKPQTVADFKATYPPGTPAYSSRLMRQVIIQSNPDSSGNVMVLAGSMRMQLPWHTLGSMGDDAPKESSPRPTRTVTKGPSDDGGQIDLRGHRADEALAKLEKYLDQCMIDGQDRIRVVHGFGTEQLKKAIRQFLSKSRYVSKWMPGEASDGGDGSTVVILSD